MTHSLTSTQLDQLQKCFSLAQDPSQHRAATQVFAELQGSLSADSPATALLEALWNEILAARRSALFWQQISDAEKAMAERLAANHFQLQQNYLRLMQEQ